MLVVIPVCGGDLELALKNIAIAKKLDNRTTHECLISHPSNTLITDLQKECESFFSSVRVFTYTDWGGNPTWPHPQNWAFQETARHISMGANSHWLWWEMDAVPLCASWLDTLDDAYAKGGRPFAGHIVNGMGHMNGVAIYPPKLDRYARRVFLTRSNAFDIIVSQEVGDAAITKLNHLIGHRIKNKRVGTSFATDEDVQSLIASGIVIFHGCSDGTLHNRILGGATGEPAGLIQTLMQWKYGKGKWTVGKATRKIINILTRGPEPRLVHCVERHKQHDADAERRVLQAQESWLALYATKRVIPAHVWNCPRNSEQIGDSRRLPFLKDVLLAGLNGGLPDDFVMWTNDDTILHSGIPDLVIPEVARKGAVASFRVNIEKGQPIDLSAPIATIVAASRALNPPGDIDLGRDLFAFSKTWLREHWHEIPDFLLGELEFDLILGFLVRKHAGFHTTKINWDQRIDACELPRGYVIHERHNRIWTNRSQEASAAKQWNRKLATEWYADNQMHSLITTRI